MPRENQEFSNNFYSMLTLNAIESHQEAVHEDDDELAMFSMFARMGVEPTELFDLKLARQMGQIYDEHHESLIEIDF
jgi:hypothetical protein